MKTSRAFFAAAIGGILWLASAGQAYAYLDPGTGSMLLQGLIGAIAAAIAVISLYYHRFKAFLFRKFSKFGNHGKYKK